MIPDGLNREIAQRLFGWTRDESWGCLLPPGWPDLASWQQSMGTPQRRIYREAMQRIMWREAITREIEPPNYPEAALATARVWQWVEEKGITFLTYGYVATPGEVECTAWGKQGEKWKGYGATWQEALCLCALAVCDALQETPTSC